MHMRCKYFQNSQLAILSRSMECVDVRYEIRDDDLHDVRDGLPDWSILMAVKNWVYVSLFIEAFEQLPLSVATDNSPVVRGLAAERLDAFTQVETAGGVAL
jgi:hypothetical protein